MNLNDNNKYSLDTYHERMIERGFQQMEHQATTHLDSRLDLNPHYSDPLFSSGQNVTVFGSKEPGLNYVYSDRLWQWDYEKADESRKQAQEEVGNCNTARYVQRYLSLYLDKEVEVGHILTMVNVSNGYPLWAAGYKEVES